MPCIILNAQEFTKEQRVLMNEFLDATIANNNKQSLLLAATLNITERCADDVAYLRTRNRHSQALEDELIALHKAGTPPKISEFGCTKETGEALLNAAMEQLSKKHPDLVKIVD